MQSLSHKVHYVNIASYDHKECTAPQSYINCWGRIFVASRSPNRCVPRVAGAILTICLQQVADNSWTSGKSVCDGQLYWSFFRSTPACIDVFWSVFLFSHSSDVFKQHYFGFHAITVPLFIPLSQYRCRIPIEHIFQGWERMRWWYALICSKYVSVKKAYEDIAQTAPSQYIFLILVCRMFWGGRTCFSLRCKIITYHDISRPLR